MATRVTFTNLFTLPGEKPRRVRRRRVRRTYVAPMDQSKVPADMRVPLDYGKRRGDCGVVAVAIAGRTEYQHAHSVLYPIVHRRCQRWHGGTSFHERCEAMAIMGIKWTQLDVPDGLTLAAWIRDHRPYKRTRYMVQTMGHVQIIKGDYITDQAGCRPIKGSPGMRKRVLTVLALD